MYMWQDNSCVNVKLSHLETLDMYPFFSLSFVHHLYKTFLLFFPNVFSSPLRLLMSWGETVGVGGSAGLCFIWGRKKEEEEGERKMLGVWLMLD